ncbi:MAG: DUF1571 domain-containing protein [Fimbriiglobus sp.]
MRYLSLPIIGAITLWVTPLPEPSTFPSKSSPPVVQIQEIPTSTEFETLLRTSPYAALEAARARSAREAGKYRVTMVKQERLAGVWHPEEEIDMLWRAEPLAVRMIWKRGSRKVLGTAVEGSLYIAGQNGKMTVWRPTALASFLRLYELAPHESQARAAARYAINEASFTHTLDRCLLAWKQGRIEYHGIETHPEIRRPCHKLERTCPAPELDRFLASDPPRDASKHPQETFAKVTLWLDTETWLPLGSELMQSNGQPLGRYFFRNLEWNPTITATDFTPAAFTR